jgi:Cu-Zn family superoxide dismutase
MGAALFASSCILVSSCVFVSAKTRKHDHDEEAHSHRHAGALTAVAMIEGRSGSSMSGKAVFTEKAGGVLVELWVEDTPPGMHAVHVHETGDCSSEDGKSAGGHFNPGEMAHGSPHMAEHHAGDLGNMWVEEDGTGYHAIFMPVLTVAAGTHSVDGRGIIVHAGVDDLVSQPTGAAGGRIGCGVIRLAR